MLREQIAQRLRTTAAGFGDGAAMVSVSAHDLLALGGDAAAAVPVGAQAVKVEAQELAAWCDELLGVESSSEPAAETEQAEQPEPPPADQQQQSAKEKPAAKKPEAEQQQESKSYVSK